MQLIIGLLIGFICGAIAGMAAAIHDIEQMDKDEKND